MNASHQWHHCDFVTTSENDMPHARFGAGAKPGLALVILCLGLVACGGEPSAPASEGAPDGAPPAAVAEPPPAATVELTPLAEEIRRLLRVTQAANLLMTIGTPTLPPRIVHREVDLDGVDPPEVLVLQLGAADCTSAICQLDILARDPNGHLKLRQSVRNASAPLGVGPLKPGGWRDLVRTDSAPGELPASVTMVFDGQNYLDGERAKSLPADAELLLDNVEAWQQSIPLMD
jgi:hypothetical protein